MELSDVLCIAHQRNVSSKHYTKKEENDGQIMRKLKGRLIWQNLNRKK